MTSITISIPSYNNAKVLEKTLDSIFCDIELIRTKTTFFEVLLCDNISTDNTQEIVQPYLDNYPEMRYYLNKKHVCGSSNIISSALKAKGEYVWIVGDDVILPNAISNIADEISGNNPDSIFLASEVWNTEITSSIKSDPHYAENKWITPQDIHHNHDLGFVGNFVIKRTVWTESAKQELLYRTLFPHIFVFLTNIERIKTYRLAKQSSIIIRGGNRTPFAYMLIGVDYINLITQILPYLSSKESQKHIIKNATKSVNMKNIVRTLPKVNLFLRIYAVKQVWRNFKYSNLLQILVKTTFIFLLLLPQILLPIGMLLFFLLRMARINLLKKKDIYLIKNEIPKFFNEVDI